MCVFFPGLVIGEITPVGRRSFRKCTRGMEHDITSSVGADTSVSSPFYSTCSSAREAELWMLTLLAWDYGRHAGAGRVIYGNISGQNVGSRRFARLAVDWITRWLVHSRKALEHPEMSFPKLDGAIAPSIFWRRPHDHRRVFGFETFGASSRSRAHWNASVCSAWRFRRSYEFSRIAAIVSERRKKRDRVARVPLDHGATASKPRTRQTKAPPRLAADCDCDSCFPISVLLFGIPKWMNANALRPEQASLGALE